jgi:hypothetical protein
MSYMNSYGNNLLSSAAWRTIYLLRSVGAHLRGALRKHFRAGRMGLLEAILGVTKPRLWVRRGAMIWPIEEVTLQTLAEPKTKVNRDREDFHPSSHLLLDERYPDVEEFLSKDFAGRIGLVRERYTAALGSAALAQVWAHFLDYLITKNAAPGILIPLAREAIVLNPGSADVNRFYELLFPARETSPRTIVHMITSCEPRIHKALRLRERLLARKHPTVIIVGRPGARVDTLEDGIMAVDAPDTYEALPRKVMEALVAVRRRFGIVPVLKIDDDCAVMGTPRHSEIMAIMAAHQFAGELAGGELFDRCWHFGKCSSPAFNEPYARAFLGFWPRGTLYYLSGRAVELLVRNYILYPGIITGEMFEDKMVSDLLRSHGIYPAHVDLGSIFALFAPNRARQSPTGPTLAPNGE